LPAPRIIVEESVREKVPGVSEALTRGEAFSEALRALSRGERVLLASGSAWALWALVAREAWMRGDNYFLLEAADLGESELSGVGYGQLVVARAAYAARLSPERVEFEKLGLREKRVTRRALLAGAGVGAALAAVEKPYETSLCSTRGVGGACRACIEECGGGSCASALCGVELVGVAGYSREALAEYLRVVSPRGPGYLVFASRWVMYEIVARLREPGNRPPVPVYLVPTGCPYVVGLEELLAARALGLEPLVYADGGLAEKHDPYCRRSRDKWLETVAADYEALAGAKPAAGPGWRPLVDRLQYTPRLRPLGDAAALLGRGLHSLAMAEAERLLSGRGFTPTRSLASAGLRVDPEKCTLCSACVQECPADALQLDRSPEAEKLLFLPGRCIACRYCAEVCPEGAIEVERGLEPSPGSWRTLVEHGAVRCISCGAPLGPRTLLEKVLRKMAEHGFPEETLRTVFLCDRCKAAYQLGALRPDWGKIPDWAAKIIEERRRR